MPYIDDQGNIDQGTVTLRRDTCETFRSAARRLGLTSDTLMARLLEEGLDRVREGRVTEIQEGGGA